MANYSVKVENLSKRYLIRHRNSSGDGFRHAIQDFITASWRGFTGQGLRNNRQIENSPSVIHQSKSSTEDFWALKDVSFEVKRGEVVGIIGRNGAGKSTLLKILSRISEPSEGRIRMRGRLASLLEVGTGFHPELTGRENIFLNGSVLGMTRAEIHQKFDEIVAFSEIEKFIDTPVKRYSSGMYVRLAFAVAAHLEPEIMIVDEVLAVGDAGFQEKCLGKMGAVAKEGRTVVMVSHNMVAIRQLCEAALWLESGCLKEFGPCGQVVETYSSSYRRRDQNNQSFGNAGEANSTVQLVSYRITDAQGREDPPPTTNQDVVIRILMVVREPIQQPAFGISVSNSQGILMTSINTVEQGMTLEPLPAGEMELVIELENVTYLPGIYTASVWVMNPNGHIYARADESIVFELAQSPLYGTCQVDHRWGCVYTNVNFDLKSQATV